MPIDIDGCNATFRSFAQFAQQCVDANGENGAVKNTRVGAGSKMEAQIELSLRPAEMDRLAGLDFSKFDETEAKQLFAGTSNNKLETIYNGFPPEFRLNYDNIACSSHFKATIN